MRLVGVFLTCSLVAGLDENLLEQCHAVRRFELTQEKAPRDLAQVNMEVTHEVNRGRVDGQVRDVEVEWPGEVLHAKVGEWIVKAQVEGRLWCFVYDITDVDECRGQGASDGFHQTSLPASPEWFHRCHPSTECVNTYGSYECRCSFIPSVGRRSSAKVTKWPCQGLSSSSECCSGERSKKGDSSKSLTCREEFECYVDECGHSDCDRLATCTPLFDADRFTCQCPEGYRGNGRKCTGGEKFRVFHRGDEDDTLFLETTTDEYHRDEDSVCGCHKPEINNCPTKCCDGRTPCNEQCNPRTGQCECMRGFTFDEGLNRCVDPTPPKVWLKDQHGRRVPGSKSVVVVSQCHEFVEFGFDIEDDNAEETEDFLRHFKTIGSPPGGCFKQMQNFTITYMTWNAWTEPHSAYKDVRVVDADECGLDRQIMAQHCPSCVTRCAFDQGSSCKNTFGSYTCECPLCGGRGDGFEVISDLAPGEFPEGYVNGSGCQDSCPPHITLLGANPAVFRVCKCEGPLCPEHPPVQRAEWEEKIRALVRTSPNTLCDQKKGNCVQAVDRVVGGGEVDVSASVVIGNPEWVGQRGQLLVWRLPYDVVDQAGNKATTKYREIHVQELTLGEVEAETRKAIGTPSPVPEPAPGPSKASPKCKACPACPQLKCNCPECPVCDSRGVTGAPQTMETANIHNVYPQQGEPEVQTSPALIIVLTALLGIVLCCICVLRDPSEAREEFRGLSQGRASVLSPRRLNSDDAFRPSPSGSGINSPPGSALRNTATPSSRSSFQASPDPRLGYTPTQPSPGSMGGYSMRSAGTSQTGGSFFSSATERSRGGGPFSASRSRIPSSRSPFE